MSQLAKPVVPDLRPAVAALAAALPVPVPLAPADVAPVAADAEVPLPEAPGAAVVARLGVAPGSPVEGQLVVVVAADLVEALRSSPLGELDVAAAVQPALDAAAAALGTTAERASELPLEVALEAVLGEPGAHLAPLVSDDASVVATVVIAATSGAVAAAPTVPAQMRANGLELLRDVEMEVTVELGRTRMSVRELLSLSPGAVVELDRAAGSPADLLVNGTLIARGEVVVVDEDFGIRITEIVGPNANGAAGAAGAA
ncbi:MAG: flagellar motor switch protein FliN [Motilibacteraceae bacterium]